MMQLHAAIRTILNICIASVTIDHGRRMSSLNGYNRYELRLLVRLIHGGTSTLLQYNVGLLLVLLLLLLKIISKLLLVYI